MRDPDLRVQLENRLPGSLPAGCATAIFCFGHCFHRHEQVAALELIVDGSSHRPTAMRMPRRDLFEWLSSGRAREPGDPEEDPERRSYRSGFWATVPIRAGAAPGAIQLHAAVRLASGATHLHPLARIEIVEPEPAPSAYPEALPGRTIAICIATFEPEPGLLRAQLESLRQQTDERWVCVISDDGSSDERFAQLLELVEGDSRFIVSRSDERLGPARNFERALSAIPAGPELVALCDQDDRWYPDKLATLRGALGSAQLVYSDQRLVSADGRVLRDSLWEQRRNDHSNIASLLIANSVPGSSMLFRRELLEPALPFPAAPGIPYHDHWLALVALCRGEIAYVGRPLFDWVQHGASASRPAQAGGGAGRTSASRGWRAAYFAGYATRAVQAQTLLLRCGPRLTARKRRALEWFVAAERSPPSFLWLGLRPLHRLVGRGETLGGETALARGILWRWLIVLAVGRAQRPGRRAYDASFPDPPRFEQRRLARWRSGA